MRYDLARMAKVHRPRVKEILIRDIAPPAMFATDLYAACYRPIVQGWERTIPRIMAEYTRSLPIADAITDSASDLSSLLDMLGDELSRLVLDLVPDLRDWTVRYEKWHANRWRGNVLTATGVDIQTILMATGEPISVGETIAWNVALMKDVNQQAQQRISNSVFAGLQARKPARDVAREIREATGMSRRRSTFIAADQLAKLSGSLDTERMSDAGIERWKYRHGGKLHPRKWHKDRDGHIFELATGKEIGGPDQIAAGDWPTQPPWCSCRKQALLSLS